MGRGGGVSPKRNFKRGVRSKDAGSDDSDEDYVISDEENEISACSDEDFCSSADGYASEASDRLVEEEEVKKVRRKVKKVDRSKKPKNRRGRYKEEEEDQDEDEDEDKNDKEDEDEDYNEEEDEEAEEVKMVGRGGQKNGVKPSQKRRRFGSKEDEDDDDEEFTPSDNEEDEDEDEDGDDFTEDEKDSLDEEESRVKRKNANTKVGKRVLRKKSVRGRKRRKRSMASKKPARKKARKASGFRRKVRSDDDDDFIDNGVVLREQGEAKRGLKKRRYVVDSDSDVAPAPSNEYEYTISEEEREQVREAEEFCRVKRDSRSPSVPEKIQEDKVLLVERKHKERKGKEKVEEEVKTEVAKRVCGICFSEEDKRRVRGTVNCCEHYFCFTCISEWAKVESRCPLCKQRFNTISKRARSSVVDPRVVTILVPERDQVYLPTEDEVRSYLYPYEDVICSECHQGGHDDLMLLCDECDSSAHTFCVGLGHEVPEGSWFCRDCKPLDPESSNSPQTHLSDQSLANNTSINRASAATNNAGESFDLNSVSSHGLAALPSPRQQFGGFQVTMPLAGAGASTVSGRIWLRHQIHQCLSERPDRPEGNFPSSQLEQARETIQQESAQLLDERFCENHSPVGQGSDLRPSNNLSQHPIREMGQNPNPTTILSGIANDALWPGLEERNSLLGFEQQLRQCNGGPNSGCVRQEVDFQAAKEQLQLMVKSHLKNLSRGSDLAQSKLEEIAKCSTQTILGVCGLEHNEVIVLPVSPPPTCDHIEIMAPGKPSLLRGCCSSCFDSFIGDIVKKILDAKLSEVQQWLCLAL